ncbi:recombinase family protein [Pontibacter vulgaris]|uniref:recombinase family protein n=1 Tax=Pontibacter vulgaris TaxID=2905679 RepID=UPI001FA70826|nr:recombinase family protein [Pontibacter vulgaris]
MNYIAYYRTSTKEQSLGINAQQTTVIKFLKSDDSLIAEYTEQESGKNDKRVELAKAIEHCRATDSTLLIAKLDRLSRNVSFISQLMDQKVKFKCCDMPDANNFTIHIFSALAQQERELISTRTKAALSELKARGVKLGKPENLNQSARMKGVEAIKANAEMMNRQVTEFINLYREKGMTYDSIATKLNDLGYRTRYKKNFSKGTVKIMHDRYKEFLVVA